MPISLAVVLVSALQASHPAPVERFRSGDYETALSDQRRLADDGKENRAALENCRLASMAMATGDDALAEKALRRAVATMHDFSPNGEWRAAVFAEQSKDWHGEPYEKMMASFYLAALLFERGDYQNALAMSKSAILADTGTSEERYRSDFVPAWLLQAMTLRALHDDAGAQQSFQRVLDASASRILVPLLSDEAESLSMHGRAEVVRAARVALLASIPGAVTQSPDSPAQAARIALSDAAQLLRSQREGAKRDLISGLEGISDRSLEDAIEILPGVSEAWIARVTAASPQPLVDVANRANAYRALFASPVVLFIERGTGPHKIATGEHRELLEIERTNHATGAPSVEVDGGSKVGLMMEDLTWQAQTRGGRRVDSYLHGKAVFKGASLAVGNALLQDAATATTREEFATYAIAGLAATAIGAATITKADTREWDLLPGVLWAYGVRAEPGDVTVRIQGKAHHLTVPAEGQTLSLVPALHPPSTH